VHYLPHQLPDDRPRQLSEARSGDPSLALSDGCNGLRTRSLKPRRVAVSNPASGANDASVTIRPPLPTPVQQVSPICAETDVPQLSSTNDPDPKPSNRHTLKPCATPASGVNSTHPSPSARPFRLPFNKLAPSELRRIFYLSARESFAPTCLKVLRPEGSSWPWASCLPLSRYLPTSAECAEDKLENSRIESGIASIRSVLREGVLE